MDFDFRYKGRTLLASTDKGVSLIKQRNWSEIMKLWRGFLKGERFSKLPEGFSLNENKAISTWVELQRHLSVLIDHPYEVLDNIRSHEVFTWLLEIRGLQSTEELLEETFGLMQFSAKKNALYGDLSQVEKKLLLFGGFSFQAKHLIALVNWESSRNSALPDLLVRLDQNARALGTPISLVSWRDIPGFKFYREHKISSLGGKNAA